jgi:galactokinase
MLTTVIERFTAEYGAAPAGVWSAPGRINLIGEHTDYNGGFALPLAIDRRTLVAARLRRDQTVSVSSTAFPGSVTACLDGLTIPTGAVKSRWGWAVYPLAVAWALTTAEQRRRLPGVDLLFASSLPVGGGLSSSAALELAAAGAFSSLWELELDEWAMVHTVRRAENDFVGAPTGILDQAAGVFGREGCAVLLDCLEETAEPIELRLRTEGLALLVIDTRTSHAHADGGYAERRTSCERAADQLGGRFLREFTAADLTRARSELDAVTYRRARHVITENERVLETTELLRAGAPRRIGPLLLASHSSMRDDFEISTPQLDLAVDAAMHAGAFGARMTGGGFGGSVIALVESANVDATVARVAEAFAVGSYPEPHVFVASAGAGMRRDS